LQNILKTLGQISLLCLIYYLSSWTVEFLHLPLPGSVLGMLLLFALLSAGILKEEWLSLGANPLLKHLSFFFIPIAVELMDWGELFTQKGHLLFLPLVISALVALVVTGGMFQLLTKSPETKGGTN
jgi:holin-like protein